MSTNTSVWLETGLQERDGEDSTELQELAAFREGSLHFCEGPLRRRRHRAQTKANKWKQKWFKVEPGKEHEKVAGFFEFRNIIGLLLFPPQLVEAKTRIS